MSRAQKEQGWPTGALPVNGIRQQVFFGDRLLSLSVMFWEFTPVAEDILRFVSPLVCCWRLTFFFFLIFLMFVYF